MEEAQLHFGEATEDTRAYPEEMPGRLQERQDLVKRDSVAGRPTELLKYIGLMQGDCANGERAGEIDGTADISPECEQTNASSWRYPSEKSRLRPGETRESTQPYPDEMHHRLDERSKLAKKGPGAAKAQAKDLCEHAEASGNRDFSNTCPRDVEGSKIAQNENARDSSSRGGGPSAPGIREISCKDVENAICGLFLKACIRPENAVCEAVAEAAQTENVQHAKEILRQLQENNEIARAEQIPACQDTGMAIVFADIGQDVHFTDGSFEEAVNAGVRRAYEEGYFRKSVLDPLTRKNTGNNLPAVIHTRIVPGKTVRLTAVPKGFGSENMSRLAMLRPSDGREGIKKFIVDAAKKAGGSPCPPVVLGIGIGGTFESCALMAKRALLRPLGEPAASEDAAQLERELSAELNALGIGPMGLGGETYCLGVHIETEPTHIAALPVAVNFSCHMLRHETTEL